MWTVFVEIVLAVILYTNIAVYFFFLFGRLYGLRKYKSDLDMLATGIVNDLLGSDLLTKMGEPVREALRTLIDQYLDQYRIANFKNQQHSSMLLHHRNESLQRRIMFWLFIVNVLAAAVLIVLALLSRQTFDVMLEVFLVALACAVTEVAYFFLIHKRYVYVDSLGIKLGGKKMDVVLT